MSYKLLLLLSFSLIITLRSPAQVVPETKLQPEVREYFVQKANESRRVQDYKSTIAYLDSILFYNPIDAPILLFKGDVLLQDKKFKEASAVYDMLLPLDYLRTTTLVNYSYALFMNHKPNLALQYAHGAWQSDSANLNATVNYFNALLWNGKTARASAFLSSIRPKLDNATLLVLQARLHTTGGNYTKGLEYYDFLFQSEPNKHYIIEYVEVLLAKKQVSKARAIIEISERYLSETDIIYLRKKCEATIPSTIGLTSDYFKDVASNKRVETHFQWMEGQDKTYRFGLNAGQTRISSSDQSWVNVMSGSMLMEEKWGLSFSGSTELKYQQIAVNSGRRFQALTGSQEIKYTPHDHLMFGVYAKSELMNFTVSLLGSRIRNNVLGYKTNVMINNRNGFYSEGDISRMSDKNQRNLIFTSLYHIFRTEPTIKAGLNASYLSFTKNNVSLYFAPETFINSELFIDYLTPLNETSKYYLKTQAALGVQKIEKNKWQQGFRYQAEIGSHLKRFDCSLRYQASNVASSTALGYKFSWFTFNVNYKW